MEWSGVRPGQSKGQHAHSHLGERGLVTYVVMDEQREAYIIRIEWP
ncbi:hypothetical protein BJ982_000242 [Sphaerisporangium siamense]|uniref:Uncharacterized protein n=1 Tax=Sphaerisporangium siamense TaxID=795645 RepID=A0A7W7D1S6_9ACTN|nr:hypothetical protein [Sphaerisporangium siamense]